MRKTSLLTMVAIYAVASMAYGANTDSYLLNSREIPGYLIVVQKNNGVWVSVPGKTINDVKQDENLEAVIVNLDSRVLGTPLVMNGRDRGNCYSNNKREGVYDLCRTEFSKVADKKVVVNTIFTVATAGLGTLMTGFLYTPEFDFQNFRRICEEADVVKVAKGLALDGLRQKFTEAKTLQDFSGIINKYRGVDYDTEGILEKVQDRIEFLQKEKNMLNIGQALMLYIVRAPQLNSKNDGTPSIQTA